MKKRPLAVTIIACVYILTGAIGFVYHFAELGAGGAFQYDALSIELIRLVAIVCGAFLLRGHNWARWVAIAWMGLHVVLSVFQGWPQVAIHCLFFGVIAWFLFRGGAQGYFRAGGTDEPAGR